MQGFNMGRYRAPSQLDPSLSTSSSKTRRAPGTAAKNPTVRFEMPFAVWCSTCPAHSLSSLIGQGVRFNAQKRLVGKYFSTPVFSFRIKHTACGGGIEFLLEPHNHDFIVTEGAKRRDFGDDAIVATRTDAALLDDARGGARGEDAQKKMDAFAALEGKVGDRVRAKTEKERLEELRMLAKRDWGNPDAASARVRRAFRAGRRARQADGEKKEKLAELMGLGFELLDEDEADKVRAGLVEFGERVAEGDERVAQLKAASMPLFGSMRDSNGNVTKKKTSQDVGEKREALRKKLGGNTRAVMDPFAIGDLRSEKPPATHSVHLLSGLKRKRNPPPISVRPHDGSSPEHGKETEQEGTPRSEKGSGEARISKGVVGKCQSVDPDLGEDTIRKDVGMLVDYDSD